MAALLFGACRGKDEPLGPIGSVPQGTTTTNPYAVPEVIDEAYVNRVLAGLDRVVGDIVRIVVATKTIPPEAVERLRTVYLGDLLQLKIDLFQDDMFDYFRSYRENPGNRKVTVTELIAASPSCIFAEVRKDISAVTSDPNPDISTQWVQLVPLDQTVDPNDFNPTGWGFEYEGFRRDLSQPDNQCVG